MTGVSMVALQRKCVEACEAVFLSPPHLVMNAVAT